MLAETVIVFVLARACPIWVTKGVRLRGVCDDVGNVDIVDAVDVDGNIVDTGDVVDVDDSGRCRWESSANPVFLALPGIGVGVTFVVS